MKRFESTYERITRESKAEGKAEGRVETLLRQIARRFGTATPATEARVRAASSAELDRWTDRILDASSLAELLAE